MGRRLKTLRRREPVYYRAYDPITKRRDPHVFKNGYLISLTSGHRFKFNPKKLKEGKKDSEA